MISLTLLQKKRVKTLQSKVYINGNFVDSKDAVVSVFDRGLNYGDGLFETLKAKDGRPLFFSEHMMRLKNSAKALSIHSPLMKEVSEQEGALIRELINLNGLGEGSARVKLVLTRGGGSSAGHRPGPPTDGTLIITCAALDEEYFRRLARSGVTAITSKTSTNSFTAHKTLNYLPNVMASMEAEAAGAYEAILTSKESIALEGAASNLFIVKDGHLKTPPADGLILPGIMRNSLILLANKLSIEVKEDNVSLEEVYNADEAFISNSIIGALPLISVSGSPIGEGLPGAITGKLREALETFEGRY